MTWGELKTMLHGVEDHERIVVVDRNGPDQLALNIKDVGYIHQLNAHVLYIESL